MPRRDPAAPRAAARAAKPTPAVALPAAYIAAFPLAADPARTPFAAPGDADAGHLFLYLTHPARARWSGLIAREQEEAVAASALKSLPFLAGRDAALWLLEKRFAAAAGRGRRALPTGAPELPTPRLARRLWPGMLWVVLKDPEAGGASGQGEPLADVLAFHTSEAEAVEDATRLAAAHGVATVVGLLREDWPWVAPPRRDRIGAGGPEGSTPATGAAKAAPRGKKGPVTKTPR